MWGSGVIRGMGITLRHFFDSYKADLRRRQSGLFKRYLPQREAVVQEPAAGYITIQYPEEKLKVPENFRFLPVLIRDSQTGEDWCTACGICARVCPPQCIWMIRAKKDDGKPEPKAAEFWIDTSICMQCGYCAEYCPFDAIKMDHRFELSTEERWNSWIHDMERLTVTTDYYASTHPRAWAVEDAARKEKEAKKGKGGRAAKEEAAGAARAAPAKAAAKPAAPETTKSE